MRMLNNDLALLAYVNARRAQGVGGFLDAFFDACQRADPYNYELIRPALLEIALKYPAKEELLMVERKACGLDQNVILVNNEKELGS